VNMNLQLQISTLRANVSRLPKQLARMVTATADEFDGNVAETSLANLNQMLDQTVTRTCEEVVAGRYPFAGNGPTWPSGMASASASLSLMPEMPGRESAIKFDGPWALKRLLDKADITSTGGNVEARFVIGGRDVAYTIQTNSDPNPLFLAALSGFSCPKAF
ncbi:MAG: type VI secretion system membrane subunit TssM, partial [Mesorhizobium sp.]